MHVSLNVISREFELAGAYENRLFLGREDFNSNWIEHPPSLY
jgi:hypothetical protein